MKAGVDALDVVKLGLGVSRAEYARHAHVMDLNLGYRKYHNKSTVWDF